MRMTEQQHVDAGLLGQIPVRVFHLAAVGRDVDTAVRNRDDEVDIPRAQFRQVFARSLDQSLGVDLAFEVALVPIHDRRRGEPNDTDADRRLDLAAIGCMDFYLPLQHRVRRIYWLVVARAECVCEHQRVVGSLAVPSADAIDIHRVTGDLGEKGQAIVEFVVADRAAVVVQGIHRAIHREFLIAAERFHQRLVVGQRSALNGVTGVEQQGVRKLHARLLDQGRHALETEGGIVGQPVVVVTADIRMDVGRFQDRELRMRAVGDGRVGLRHKGCASSQDDRAGNRQAKAGKCRVHRVRQKNDSAGHALLICTPSRCSLTR